MFLNNLNRKQNTLHLELSLMIIWHANCSLVFVVTVCFKSYMWGYDRNIAIELNSDEINGIYLS